MKIVKLWIFFRMDYRNSRQELQNGGGGGRRRGTSPVILQQIVKLLQRSRSCLKLVWISIIL